MRPTGRLLSFLLAWLGTLDAFARPVQDPAPAPPQDVTEIDLEDLLNVTVTSPAKREQPLGSVPSATYVIRSEDLRRTGVTSIPEALRQVPGFQVARGDGNSWTVTSRGFTSANKLLALVDGRTIYSPLHSSVFWDAQCVFLEDIDRIEVIRGPGGSLWGSNAVNGVINVITKSAEETQGGYVVAGGGLEERVFAGARYGFQAGEDQFVRISANTFDRDDSVRTSGPDEDLADDHFMARGGARWDWKIGGGDRLTVQGDWYDGLVQERTTAPQLTAPFSVPLEDRSEISGGNLVCRWTRSFSETSDLTLQVYVDHTFRSTDIFRERLLTGDLDFQHRFSPAAGHDFVWGLGYRAYRHDLSETFVVSADPLDRTDDIVSAFVQDEVVLVDGHLRLTGGVKFEHNDYSAFEVQPSLRLAWSPEERHLVWVGASRAVRTPSIIDTDLRLNALVIPGAPPTLISIFGTRDFKSEDLIALEAGWRARPVDAVQANLAFFFNFYDDLRSLEPGATFPENSPPPPHDVLPFFIENGLRAHTYGAELDSVVELASWWHLQLNYSHLYMNLDPVNSSVDTTSEAEESRSPRNQVWGRSAFSLPHNFTLDLTGRYVSRLSSSDIDKYVEADARLAWRDPVRRIEIALVGQNLVHDRHQEIGSTSTGAEIERGAYLSVSWEF